MKDNRGASLNALLLTDLGEVPHPGLLTTVNLSSHLSFSPKWSFAIVNMLYDAFLHCGFGSDLPPFRFFLFSVLIPIPQMFP